MSKALRLNEGGKIFRSAAACAAWLGVTRSAVTNHLKGRAPTVKGFTISYIQSVPHRFPPATHPPKRIIFGDDGRFYLTYSEVARANGITPAKARSIILSQPDGVFRMPKPKKAYTGDLFS
jgi:hypothetical protein